MPRRTRYHPAGRDKPTKTACFLDFIIGAGGNQGVIHMKWTSLAAFMMILLFSAAADGIMDAMGPNGFMAACVLVMGMAWILVRRGET